MLSFISDNGRPLTQQERIIFAPYFAKIVLDKARIIDGRVQFWLLSKMCALVMGSCIYLRAGAYQANTQRGIELLGHELTHVSQFLHGMTLWQYVWSCRRGYFNSPYEQQAYAKGRMIATNHELIA